MGGRHGGLMFDRIAKGVASCESTPKSACFSYSAAVSLLSLSVRRDFLREAVFLCSTPLRTALSKVLMAARKLSTVVRSLNLRTAVRTELLTMRLRRLRLAEILILLMADLVLANVVSPPRNQSGSQKLKRHVV